MRIAIMAVGALATLMALTIQSIYGLWYEHEVFYVTFTILFVKVFVRRLGLRYLISATTVRSLLQAQQHLWLFVGV